MIRVRIPATSANVGSGFDSLGLAVTMYNHIYIDEHEGIDIRSLDGLALPADSSNLVYKTAKYLYDLCGKPFKGLRIEQRSDIPLARGLGSSSACIVGGLLGANRLMGSPLSQDEIINIAAALEGHPDNSTPALLGGLVTAVLENGKVWYVKQSIQDDLCFVAIIPDFELKTSVARAALPGEIAHKDGVFNLSRAALMSVSLYSGNYQNIRVAADDRLHQPYRLKFIKGGQRVMDACYRLGAYGVYISGAGSTLMAIVDKNRQDFVQHLAGELRELGLAGWRLEPLSIDNDGTLVEADA